VLAIFTIVSIAASISAMVMAGPRVYYAMAPITCFEIRGARASRYRNADARDYIPGGVVAVCGARPAICRNWSPYTGFAVVLFFTALPCLSVFVLRPGVSLWPRSGHLFFTALGLSSTCARESSRRRRCVMVVYELVNNFRARRAQALTGDVPRGVRFYFWFSAAADDTERRGDT
jgi:hypothetical protein